MNNIKYKININESEVNLPHWRTNQITPENALESMFKNSLKAISEHQFKERNYPLNRRIVIPVTKPDSCPLPSPLQLKVTCHTVQGSQPIMKDTHFAKELPEGLLAAVFEGHGGNEASQIANDHFSHLFEDNLAKSTHNVHYSLEKTFEELQAKMIESTAQGTSAVVCYIERDTNRIYTATLGDSEAHIYRMHHDRMQAIPASCVRNWTSHRDAIKLAEANIHNGLDAFKLSRALGDRECPIISQKPKITVHQLLPGDVVNLATENLKERVPEKVTAQTVHMLKLDPEFTDLYSKVIVDDAIHLQSKANITAVTIQIA